MKNIFLYYKNVYFLAVLGQHFNEISEIGLLISVLVVGTKKKKRRSNISKFRCFRGVALNHSK